MPGANYFLSKVAAQIPGPLVGDVCRKLPPAPCMEIVPMPKPLIDVIGSPYKPCTDIIIRNNHRRISGNGFPRPVVKNYPCGAASLNMLSKGHLNFELPITGKGLEENPVGELQELCTKMRWVFPTYSVCCENGQPHERTFVVLVRLYHLREKGEAKSKKAAKREAARQILLQLIDKSSGPKYPLDNRAVSGAIEYIPTTDVVPQHFHAQPQQPRVFYDVHTPDVGPIDVLEELASKRNLRIIYVKLDSKSASGMVQVMLQVTAYPIIVCQGQGRSLLAAKADAALNALECLRLTTTRVQASRMIHFSP